MSASVNPQSLVPARPEQADKVRKILVVTFNRADYELLEEMTKQAQVKIPDIDFQGVCSMILADACRHQREREGKS